MEGKTSFKKAWLETQLDKDLLKVFKDEKGRTSIDRETKNT